MQQIFFLFLLFFITAYWIDSVRVKELARQAGHYSCKKHNVQFLDNTVVKQKTSIKRHHSRLFVLQRHYAFEYSADGNQRESGIIIMQGHRLSEIQMDLHTYDNQQDR
ncbi:MAG: DUF3301 domain-containing protein [Gammaproteobacteria bacterium]|nr:DUF3301 domain-containing protein [Gammaproteobacteria bacterium]